MITREDGTTAVGLIGGDDGTNIKLLLLDKCAVEVFAKNRQDVLIWDDHPTEELGISFFSTGGDLRVQEVKCWTMKSIYGK